MSSAILRLPAVVAKRGRRRSTHYDDIKKGLCTPPVLLGARSVGWPEHEIDAINSARIAGKGDDEIRRLVRDMVAARRSAE